MKNIQTFLLMLFFTNCYSQYVFEKKAVPEKVSLESFTEIINAEDEVLDIQEVILKFDQQEPKLKASIQKYFGYTNDNFWAKVAIQNKTNQSLNYLLSTATPMTNLVELYIVDEQSKKIKKIVNGASLNYSKRILASNEVLFDLSINPDTNLDLYIHYSTTGGVVAIPMELYSYESFYKNTIQKKFINGIFYGLVIQFSLFLIFLYFAMRGAKIVTLAFFIFLSGLIAFMLDGYFSVNFNHESGVFLNNIFLLILILTGLFLGKFGELSLKIKKNNKKLFYVFQIFYVLNISLFPLQCIFKTHFALFLILSNLFGFILFLLIGFALLTFKNRKDKIIIFFVLGNISLFVGYLIYTLKIYGILDSTTVIESSTKISIALAMILFTIREVVYLFRLRILKNNLSEKALIKAQEIKDLKCYLLCNISHELRTPLNVIMNLNRDILEKNIDTSINKKCENIQNSSENLLNSINDILDFSKIEKKELKLDNLAFNPLQTLTRIRKTQELRVTEKGLKFNFSESEGFPNLVIGDESRFSQIINNLLNNAIKFTSVGFVDFDIKSKVIPNNKVRLTVSITDSGVGIENEKIDRIFDSFSQNSIDNKRAYGGIGLGLYIVKSLIDMQGGIVEVKSVLGKGTNFKISIDFDIVVQSQMEIVAAVPAVYDLGGKSILVVEDNKMNQMIIDVITKKWLNTKVLYVNNGQEALEAFETNHFDIVLMDLQMPIMDGYEATVAIRDGEAGAHNCNIPIIAVTADVMETTKNRVKEIGMNDYLSKPIKKETLYKAIKKLV
ncbi:hybrid sensor histidine kinase/response regulator [Flavobacterium petrolei]|uniref:histidine kinase n=1 Tax=Flavobacterium petrolei TaxID=2259594 RepID=A0A482TSW2_9FLAO|nr:hybrid sensor histidine kinase/response regulator [Flavobacterium petrolei]RYJ50952.1 hybrid sensor histidine kinase/response regulator [Flavobacterium petrolei]